MSDRTHAKRPDLDSALIRELYEGERLSVQDIAQRMDCHPWTICRRLHKMGVEMRQGGVEHWSAKQREAMSDWWKEHPEHRPMEGHKHSLETRQVMSSQRKEENNPNWRNGSTPDYLKGRQTANYQAWRREVLARADGICQECGRRAPLQAHHSEPYIANPDRALDIDNGRALCARCHRLVDAKRIREAGLRKERSKCPTTRVSTT